MADAPRGAAAPIPSPVRGNSPKITPRQTAAQAAAAVEQQCRDQADTVTLSGGVLYDCDHVAQETCTAIRLLSEAAEARLAPDADALCDVRELLRLIREKLHDVEDFINEQASEHHCNYVDHAARAFRDAMKKGGAA